MFMTTKTHERLLRNALNNVHTTARSDRELFDDTVSAQTNIIAKQRDEIAEMQHFYNKGRAVHAADVRYEAKKRDAKIKVNAS